MRSSDHLFEEEEEAVEEVAVIITMMEDEAEPWAGDGAINDTPPKIIMGQRHLIDRATKVEKYYQSIDPWPTLEDAKIVRAASKEFEVEEKAEVEVMEMAGGEEDLLREEEEDGMLVEMVVEVAVVERADAISIEEVEEEGDRTIVGEAETEMDAIHTLEGVGIPNGSRKGMDGKTPCTREMTDRIIHETRPFLLASREVATAVWEPSRTARRRIEISNPVLTIDVLKIDLESEGATTQGFMPWTTKKRGQETIMTLDPEVDPMMMAGLSNLVGRHILHPMTADPGQVAI
jgi:hypothetical protein